MDPILTPAVLFDQAGIAADANAMAMRAAQPRRASSAQIAGPLSTTDPSASADRYRAVAVQAGGVVRPTDPLRRPTHLERTATSPVVALRGVLATVLALEAGAASSLSATAGADGLGW